MINTAEIEESLKTLCNLYDNNPTSREGIFYSKLAILELSGWLEESIDQIAEDYLNNNPILNADEAQKLHSLITKTVYNFSYQMDPHAGCRAILIDILGAVKVSMMDKEIENIHNDIFANSLNELEKNRNRLAHKHIQGTTPQFPSPSVTFEKFATISPIISDIESYVINCQ